MKHFHLLPWGIIALLILAAFILRFVLWGYSFSALVCCCLAGIIAFLYLKVVQPSLRVMFPPPPEPAEAEEETSESAENAESTEE